MKVIEPEYFMDWVERGMVELGQAMVELTENFKSLM